MVMLLRDVRSGKRRAAITELDTIVRKEIEKVLDEKVTPAMIKSHELIVANWKNKVTFSAEKSIRPDKIRIFVFPTGPNKQIWIYVDQGTKPHPIKPRKKPLLIFSWGGPGSYIPKTKAKPARTVAGGGKVQNAQIVRSTGVDHPGSEAREFSRTIAEDIKPEFKKEIENAFRRTSALIQE